MYQSLINLSTQRRYWAALVVTGFVLELVALYYQYALNEWPCVLCIHIRIWIVAFILVGIFAFFHTRSKFTMRLAHGINTLIMLAFVERSWQVLAVERGWVFGDCAMDLGMPAWFALDKWLPAVFEVQTSCGYTPLIIANFTMAEVLLVFSALLAIISAMLFIASWHD